MSCLCVHGWVLLPISKVKTQEKDGTYNSVSNSKIKAVLRSKWYNALKVDTLWNFKGLLWPEFGNGFDDFKNAIMFEKSFEVDKHGKKKYYAANEHRR
ncbi:hypothetical protein Dsin_015391 [Dipteronia sinensis]|uniref:XS domain-containing protein n=1 Tax=Dipteronia sinensis TaxID=43782 RepID=A0AAE0ACH2_9ROSI|nr:hypothetical protein Dsin_015391 [Dipteronia sinensis]